MIHHAAKPIITLIIIWFALANWGCWDKTDLAALDIAVASGIDRMPGERLELTTQVVKPGVIKARSQGGVGNAVWVYSQTGDTVFEALRNSLSTHEYKIFNTYVQVIVIGEEMARNGIGDALDFYQRDHQGNPATFILLAKDTTAKRILNMQSETADIPAVNLVNTMNNTSSWAEILQVNLLEFSKALSTPGANAAAGCIHIVNDKEDANLEDTQIEGAAVFKTDRLVGWLTPRQTRGYLFTQGKVKDTIINIPNPYYPDKKVSIEVLKATAQKKVEIIDGQPVLKIHIWQEGNIGEQHGSGDLTTPAMVKKVETAVAQVIHSDILDAIRVCQQDYESDIFGFGTLVYRFNQPWWQQYQDDWDRTFAQARVEIKVESSLRRSGYITRPGIRQ